MRGGGRQEELFFLKGGRTREWVPQERQNRPGNEPGHSLPTRGEGKGDRMVNGTGDRRGEGKGERRGEGTREWQ